MAVSVMRAFAEQTNALGLEGLRNNFSKLNARGPHPNNLTFNAQKSNRTKCRYQGTLSSFTPSFIILYLMYI